MRDAITDSVAWLWQRMPGMPEMPDVLPRAEVPVYLVHKGRGAEAYFFVFDFDAFVTASRKGAFVRPALKLFAGRDDFDRDLFAGHFRKSFAEAFDEMRLALRAEQEAKGQRWGWLGWVPDVALLGGAALGAVGMMVMALALLAGRAVLPEIRMPRLWSKASETEKLEARIEGLKGRVDQALTRISVALHPELQLQAIRKGGPGDPDEITFGDWPLPEHVAEHLEDGASVPVWRREDG